MVGSGRGKKRSRSPEKTPSKDAQEKLDDHERITTQKETVRKALGVRKDWAISHTIMLTRTEPERISYQNWGSRNEDWPSYGREKKIDSRTRNRSD